MLLAPLYALLSLFVSVEDGFLYIVLSVLPVGCLFTIPFWLSLTHIKKFRVSKIGMYLIFDAVTCISPAIFGVLFFEIISTITDGKTFADGFVTLVFSIIFILIALIFWFMYWLLSYKDKNRS